MVPSAAMLGSRARRPVRQAGRLPHYLRVAQFPVFMPAKSTPHIALACEAMATRFEIVLCGKNLVSLRAAGEEALDEIQRLDKQLSVYNPASEIAHLNARAAREPVALLATSGTAAANFLPAIVEAFSGRVPLVVLTADRPHELRDVGAAQTIEEAVAQRKESAQPEACATGFH